MLSKSVQYRRLLKMYGGAGTAGQEAPLVVDGVQAAAEQEEATQQGRQGDQQQRGGAAGGGGAANDGCQMCQYVVQYIKIALASNETMAQVGACLPVHMWRARACAFTHSAGAAGICPGVVLPRLEPACPPLPTTHCFNHSAVSFARSCTTWTRPARPLPLAPAASRVRPTCTC